MKKNLPYFSILVFCFVIPYQGLCLEDARNLNLKRLVQLVERDALYQHNTWLKLLEYRGVYPGGESDIVSEDFFLADHGNKDPRAEMVATISGFLEPPQADEYDSHPVCRFPARYIWLNSHLKFDQLLAPGIFVKPICKRFLNWSDHGRVASVSLVLVSGYLGNPSSYFGHTLIKMNNTLDDGRSRLLDTTINYGAISNENDGPLEYIIKSLIGSYNGGFSHIEYYYHTHNYGELQFRDLWEYELEFTDAEVRFLVAHFWELIGKQHKYIFFNKNCASRMADVFGIIDGFDILKGNEFWVMPQNVFMNLVRQERLGQPLVRSIQYLPSRQTRFLSKLSQLSELEHGVAIHSIGSIESLERSEFNILEGYSQRRVLDTLLDYYNLKSFDDPEDQKKRDFSYGKVLSRRYDTPIGSVGFKKTKPKHPASGREPSYLQLNVVKTPAKTDGIRLVLRPAYYDILDGQTAHVPQSLLSMFKLEIDYDGANHLELRSFDLFAIESISTPNNRLPGEHSPSFKVRIAAERKDNLCETDCITPHFSVSIGYSNFLIPRRFIYSIFLGVELSDERFHSSDASLNPSLLLQTRHLGKLGAAFRVSRRLFFEGARVAEKNRGSFEARYELNKNQDVRLLFEKNYGDQISIGMGRYF